MFPISFHNFIGRQDHGSQSFYLKDGAEAIKQHVWGAWESDIADLSAIQRAVLESLISQGKHYAPFSEAAMKAYADLLHQEKISIASVQNALDALREKGLVWRAAYGDYALEDESLATWYAARPAPQKHG